MNLIYLINSGHNSIPISHKPGTFPEHVDEISRVNLTFRAYRELPPRFLAEGHPAPGRRERRRERGNKGRRVAIGKKGRE